MSLHLSVVVNELNAMLRDVYGMGNLYHRNCGITYPDFIYRITQSVYRVTIYGRKTDKFCHLVRYLRMSCCRLFFIRVFLSS